MSFTPERLSAMLDFDSLGVVDELLMTFGGAEPSFLTFESPTVAKVLRGRGRTVLANRRAFSDQFSWGDRMTDVEPRVASPDDMMAFPPGRFGFIHLRWMTVGNNVLLNALRWLRPGGVLMVELPDSYPAANLRRSPYQAVSLAVTDRLGMPSALDFPARLIRLGFTDVSCRHEPPDPQASRGLLGDLLTEGGSWPDLLKDDLVSWPEDPAAQTPFLTNVMTWGVKPLN